MKTWYKRNRKAVVAVVEPVVVGVDRLGVGPDGCRGPWSMGRTSRR